MELRRLSFLFFCVSVVSISVNGQDMNCPRITQDMNRNLLGTFSRLEAEGLIASAYVATGGEGTAAPEVQITGFNVVCEVAGNRFNTARGISVLVEFDCDSTVSSLPCTLGVDQNVVQFQFSCGTNGEYELSVLGTPNNIVSTSTTATFDTELNDTCSICVDPILGGVSSDEVTHCFPCHPDCNRGQMRCFGGEANECCNFYQQDLCVADCNGTLVADSNFFCVCPGLDNPTNGMVSSNEMTSIGESVTFTCDATISDLVGSSTLTCTGGGWDLDPPTCKVTRCPNNLVEPEGGQRTYSGLPPLVGFTATYTCEDDRVLQGNQQRTCQDDGTWDGSDPTCELCSEKIPDCVQCREESPGRFICTNCKDGFSVVTNSDGSTTCAKDEEVKPADPRSGSTCGTGCIIGIIVAIIAAIVLSTIVALVIFALYKYLNNPATKLAKTDTEGLNGVARDNPLYVDPAALEDA